MGRDYIRLRSTTDREQRLAAAKDVLELDQDSAVIDAALTHLVESHDNFEAVKQEISPELADDLSTEVVSIAMYPQVKTRG